MPLAIDHAGAFINKLELPLPGYLFYYETAFEKILSEKPELGWKYRDETAMKTWEASFSVIKSENPVASKILLICSFLNHEDIWDDLFYNSKILGDRKSTRLNSSHRCISYAVFCLKKN